MPPATNPGNRSRTRRPALGTALTAAVLVAWVVVPGSASAVTGGSSGVAVSPGISPKCIILAPACLAGAGVRAAAGSAFADLTQFVVDGASWLLTQVATLITTTTTVHLDAGWFTAHYATMVSVAAVLAVAGLLASAVGVAFTGDPARVIRGVVRLGVAAAGTGLVVAITALLLALTDSLSDYVAGDSASALTERLSTVVRGISPAAGLAPDFILLVAAVLAVGVGLMLWLELLVRSVAVYTVVLFLPLALAGTGLNGSTRWLRRLSETLLAFIASKFVIIAIFSLAAGALGESATFTGVLTGLALLAAAALSPWSLVSLLHVAEATAVGAAGVMRGRAAAAGRAGLGHASSVGKMASFPGTARGLTVTRPTSAAGGSGAAGAAAGTFAAVGVAAAAAGHALHAPGQHLTTATTSAVTGSQPSAAPPPATPAPHAATAAHPGAETQAGTSIAVLDRPNASAPTPAAISGTSAAAGPSPASTPPPSPSAGYVAPLDPVAEGAARAELMRLAGHPTPAANPQPTSPSPQTGGTP